MLIQTSIASQLSALTQRPTIKKDVPAFVIDGREYNPEKAAKARLRKAVEAFNKS